MVKYLQLPEISENHTNFPPQMVCRMYYVYGTYEPYDALAFLITILCFFTIKLFPDIVLQF